MGPSCRRSLQKGLANGDSILMLQNRLRALRTDQEPFFENILKSADKPHQEKLGSMFQIALKVNEPLSILMYSFLESEETDLKIFLVPSPK